MVLHSIPPPFPVDLLREARMFSFRKIFGLLADAALVLRRELSFRAVIHNVQESQSSTLYNAAMLSANSLGLSFEFQKQASSQ